MNPKKCITDLPDSAYAEKSVLVRTDYNVPLDEKGNITSDYRIQQSLPTLEYLLKRNAKVIIVSHLGRPKGTVVEKLRLKPVAEALQKLLTNTVVHYSDTCIGQAVTEKVNTLKPGEILILENIRFEPGETQNDPVLAKQLAALADIYVNDAFGAAHRAHASTEGITHDVPINVAGLLVERELSTLLPLLKNPDKPFTAIIGGSKISTKIDVLSQLLTQVNTMVIGGGMVFTFLKALDYNIGNSLLEEEHIETARNLMKQAETMDKIIVLPKDIVIADQFSADAKHQVVAANAIPDGWIGMDLGPQSTQHIETVLKNSKTVFWNGPLGVFEFPAFAKSTQAVAETLAELTEKRYLKSILGGGDTQAAIDQFQISPSSFTHVSTGGGATLELLEGKALPGIEALDNKIPTTSGV